MSNWHSYLDGELNAGPVHVRCDGRTAGDHPARQLATWWCDDRGWQCYAGPHRWNAESTRRAKSGHFELLVIGRPHSATDGARVCCARCGLDVVRRVAPWQLLMERAAAAGIDTLWLRDVAHMIGRGEA